MVRRGGSVPSHSVAYPAWRRWRNTHLQPPRSFFDAVVKDSDYDALLEGRNQVRRSLARKLAQRAMWFWPRIDDAADWAEATRGGLRSPTNYLRDNPTRPAQRVIDVLPRNESLLELACNSGNDLHFVYRAGFANIRAVDVSASALSEFRENFPETWSAVSVSHDLFQRYLPKQPSQSVGTVYSNGAAIELVHPSFPIVQEICRVARNGVILELEPYSAGYPRDYVGQFSQNNFSILYSTELNDGPGVSHLYHFVAN